jgi:hypothetical protein
LDGTWHVVFTVEKDPLQKDITFCALRKSEGYYFSHPVAGVSIKNPKDVDDPRRGKQAAFKRAVSDVYDCNTHMMSRFRGALWIAMGRPGYTNPESVSHQIAAIVQQVRSMFPEGG